MPVLAASLYEVILAVHIMAVVAAFGVTFAYPIIFAVGARHDPRSLPLLHRVEYTIERWLVNPGLLLVVAAGIFLATDGHHWKSFFVQWGLGAAIVIGGVLGAVMIPTSQKAEEVARRDIEAADAASAGGGRGASAGGGLRGSPTASAGGGLTDGRGASAGEAAHGGAAAAAGAGDVVFSEEYRGLVRRLALVGSSLSALVLLTILFMALKL
ncbi:MAG: hypothetical protein ACYCUM_02525 [Solirubrobacteraceae bacterium]